MKNSKDLKSLLSSCLFLVVFLALQPSSTYAAELVITKSLYSITYPDGYISTNFKQSDTTCNALKLSESTYINGSGFRATPQQVSEAYFFYDSLAIPENYMRMDSTLQTIGGKVFSVSTYQDTANKEKNSRTKVYITTTPNFIFLSVMIYYLVYADKAIADQTSALATLRFTGSDKIKFVGVLFEKPELLDLEKKTFNLQGRAQLRKYRAGASTRYFQSN